MTDVQIDSLLKALDAFARGVNEWDYGLPVEADHGDAERIAAMRAIVRQALEHRPL